jgi:hypothetical protein
VAFGLNLHFLLSTGPILGLSQFAHRACRRRPRRPDPLHRGGKLGQIARLSIPRGGPRSTLQLLYSCIVQLLYHQIKCCEHVALFQRPCVPCGSGSSISPSLNRLCFLQLRSCPARGILRCLFTTSGRQDKIWRGILLARSYSESKLHAYIVYSIVVFTESGMEEPDTIVLQKHSSTAN